MLARSIAAILCSTVALALSLSAAHSQPKATEPIAEATQPGSAQDQLLQGMALVSGASGERDLERAYALFRAAAAAGNQRAVRELGFLYSTYATVDQLGAWARAGDRAALKALAGRLAAAPSSPAQQEQAFKVNLSLAEAGDLEAQWLVAVALVNGAGVERDPWAALDWLERSSAAGNTRAAIDIPIVRSMITTSGLQRSHPRRLGSSQRSPGSRIKDCESCPEIILLPGGRFMMGSPPEEPGRSRYEGPQREVKVDPFGISTTLITFSQWDACVEAGKCRRVDRDMGWGRGEQPVINVGWNDANAYVAWLNEITPGGYRLPSEAEWEYAARAGTTTAFWWGATMKPDQAGCSDCNPERPSKPAPVRTFPPNPFGLYEMQGTVWQWTLDCVGRADGGDPVYTGAPSAAQPWAFGSVDCTNRVVRGGAWDLPNTFARSAQRNWLMTPQPDPFDANIGFRIGLDVHVE